jgi:Holliday junction resolvasome RuvABC endonuclease subunit
MLKKLKDLEHNLGYKVYDNVVCVGIDTASKSGISIVQIIKGKIKIETFTLKIPLLSTDIEEKTEKYAQHLKDFSDLFDKELLPKLKNQTNDLLVLEQSFLTINPVTYGLLRAMQGILFEKLRNKFKNIKFIFPLTARKEIGFRSQLPKGSKPKDKKKEIMTFISNIIKEPVEDDNIADALLLVFAALKK